MGSAHPTTQKMDIYLSRHAKRQMKWREVNEDEIRNTISNPEKIEDSIKGRKMPSSILLKNGLRLLLSIRVIK